MVRSNALVLSPAGAVFGALVELSARAPQIPDAAAALELARSVVPQRRQQRRRPRNAVPAGRTIEVITGPRRGTPLLTPAAGSLPALERHGLSVYRVLATGLIDGRRIAEGALVALSRRPVGKGDLIVAADRRSLRLCLVGGSGLDAPPAEGRVLGVVEAVIAEGQQRRRCA